VEYGHFKRRDNRDRDQGYGRDRGEYRDRGDFRERRGGFRDRGGNRERNDMEESVYSQKVRAGKRRTYFFDVRQTRGEDYFITITESTRKEDGFGYRRHKIFLYKEDFNRFAESLLDVVNHVKTNLMPDFDYEEFDRRQAEWEAQNQEFSENQDDDQDENPKNSTVQDDDDDDTPPAMEDEEPTNDDDDDDVSW
jgi:hypothetical protein